jgi:hypothetical protein
MRDMTGSLLNEFGVLEWMLIFDGGKEGPSGVAGAERRTNMILFFATIGVAATIGTVVLAIRSYRGRPTVGV